MATEDDYDDSLIDDLFEYDPIGELDITIRTPPPLPSPPAAPPSKKRKDELGLDKEVEVRKKRVNVKLDEQRLLSINGLPKLRKEAPQKLKFRGKGHEYKDAARLLSYYQLWADDLFRKARFRDTLQIIEKLGHSRTVRNAREDWISDIWRDKRQVEGDDVEGPGEKSRILSGAADDDDESNDDDLYSRPPPKPAASDPNALFLGAAQEEESDDDMADGFDDADFEALLNAEREKAAQGKNTAPPAPPPPPAPPARLTAPARDEFEDELEALEAMGEFGDSPRPRLHMKSPVPPRDEFEDELEALEAMGGFD